MTDFKCPDDADELDEIIKMVPLCRTEILKQVKAKDMSKALEISIDELVGR